MHELKIVFVDSVRMNSADAFMNLGMVLLGSHVKAEVPCEIKILSLGKIRKQYKSNAEDAIAIFISKIMDEKPDVVGFSANHVNQIQTLELVKRVKEKTGALTVFGGCNPTIIDDHLLNSFDFIDLIFRGESERTFVQFCKELSDMKISGQTIEKESVISSCTLAGISYLDQDGQFKRNEHPGMIIDIDSLRYADPELALAHSQDDSLDEIDIEYSRGCPFGCTFCSTKLFWGQSFRKKSVGRLIDEIKYYHDTLDIKELGFSDDNFFTDPKTALEAILKIKELGFIKSLRISTRLPSLNEEIMTALKQFESVTLFFGIESASPKVLNDMKKGISIEQVKEKLNLLEGCDKLTFTFSFIIGYPTETDDDLNKTFEFVIRLKMDFPKNVFVIFSHIEYDMHTALTDCYADNLVQISEVPFEDYISPEVRENTRNSVFFPELICPDFRLEKQDKEFFYRLIFSYITQSGNNCRFFDSVLSVLGKRPVDLLDDLYEYIKKNHQIDFVLEDYNLRNNDSELDGSRITDVLFFLFLKFLDKIHPDIGVKVQEELKLALKDMSPEQEFLLFKYFSEKDSHEFMNFPIGTMDNLCTDSLMILCDEISADEMHSCLSYLDKLSEQQKKNLLLSFLTVVYPEEKYFLFYFSPDLAKTGYFDRPLERMMPGADSACGASKTFKQISEDIERQTIRIRPHHPSDVI